MKDGISQYGRIVILALVLLSLVGFIFGGMYLYRIGGYSDLISDGVEQDYINRPPPVINAQDQTTLIDKEINIRSIISAFDADGKNISDKIQIECNKDGVYNEETGIFKSSNAGKFIFLLSVTDEGEKNGIPYKTKTTKKMTILVDNTVGQYTVTIVTVNNGVLLVNTSIARANTVIEFNPKPDTGYEFNGVDVVCVNNKSLTVKHDLNELIMPEDDIIITPKWVPIKVNVLLNPNKGEIAGETVFEKTFDNPYGELPDGESVTRFGYDFLGWSLVRSGGQIITPETIVSTPNAHYLYAQWTQKEFVITFNPNNGESTFTKNVKFGDRVGTIAVPVKEGYTFRGWVLDSDNDVVINANTKFSFNSDINVIAVWQPKSGYVRLDANGGTVTPKQIKVYYGQNYNALPNAYQMGYTFLGWYTERTGGNKVENSDIVNNVSSITLYAHWEKATYEITFDATVGNFGNDIKTVTQPIQYKEEIALPENPVCENKDFLGWYTAAEGGVKIFDGDTYEYSSNKTFYAHWSTSKYTVTFEPNGGTLSSIGSISVSHGYKYGSLPTPTRQGYTFIGWFTSAEGDGEQIWSHSTVEIERDHTLYARWEKAKYTISFSYDDENVTAFPTDNIEVEYGAEIEGINPNNLNIYPERTGYVFSYWKTENNQPIYDGDIYNFENDIVLTPVWKVASIIYFNNKEAAEELANKSASDSITFERTGLVNDKYYLVYDSSSEIGGYAENEKIISVLLSSEVSSLSEDAFKNCTSLTSVNVPNSLTTISHGAFEGCSNLESNIKLGENITSLGSRAFYNCSSLKGLSLEHYQLTSIPEYAFYGCTSLSGVLTIPASITEIGQYAFYNAYTNSAYSEGNILSFNSDSEKSLNVGTAAFQNTNFVNELIFKNVSELTLGGSCFAKSTIKSVSFNDEDMGDAITVSVGADAFNSSEISSITFPTNTQTTFTMGMSAFSGTKITKLIIPEYITETPAMCFSSCLALDTVKMPDETVSYGASLFSGCSALQNLTIPCNVAISSNMLNDTNITKLHITTGVSHSSIGSTAFTSTSDVLNYRKTNTANSSLKIKGYMELDLTSACPWTGLTSAVIDDGILNLTNYLFFNCTNLKELTMPVDCNMLNSVYLCNKCDKYSEYHTYTYNILNMPITSCSVCTERIDTSKNHDGDVFTNVNSLATLKLTKGLMSNGVYYKYFNSSSYNSLIHYDSDLYKYIPWLSNGTDENTILKTLIMEPGVINLPERMFTDNTSLSTIVMPCNLEPAGSTFADCTGVTNVTMTTGLDGYGNEITRSYDYAQALNTNGITSYDDSPWYNSTKDNMSFIIEEGITYLGNNTFNRAVTTGRYGIGSLSLPSTLRTMGEKTFQDTRFVNTHITIPTELEFQDYGYGAPDTLHPNQITTFSKVTVIASDYIDGEGINYTLSTYKYLPWNSQSETKSFEIEIKDNVTRIPDYYFYGAQISEELVIPDSVTEIGTNAFYNSAISSVSFGSGISKIDNYFLSNTSILSKITVSENNAIYSSDEFGVLFNKDKTELIRCPVAATCSSYTIPDTVSVIADNAFNGCKKLESITIPDSVTEIGSNAFENCTSLENLYYNGTADTWALIDFYNEYSNPMYCAKNTYFNNLLLTSVSFSDTTTRINNFAFTGCDNIVSLVIPDSVISIGSVAFADNISLSEISLGNSIEETGPDVFCNTAYYNNNNNWIDGILYIDNCLIDVKEDLTGICNIKNETVTLFNYSFDNCINITSIIMPDSIKTVPDAIFANLTGLQTVTLSNSLEKISNLMFYMCSSLTSVVIPDSVTDVGFASLLGCTSLGVLSVGDGLSEFSLYNTFFGGIYNLTNLSLGENISSLSDQCVAEVILNSEIGLIITCESVAVDENNTYIKAIDNYVVSFDGKTLIKAFSEPNINLETGFFVDNNITTIESYALSFCVMDYSSTPIIYIPENIKTVNDYAFRYNFLIEAVGFPNGETILSDNTFDNTYGGLNILAPENSTVYNWAIEKGFNVYAL